MEAILYLADVVNDGMGSVGSVEAYGARSFLPSASMAS